MDSGGKLLVSKHNQLLGCNLAQYMSSSVQDGERLPVAYKELGNCEFYPKTIKHSWNGRFIVAAGDGEYVIYTALQVRNKSFGSALDFIWSRAGAYAVRESSSKIKVFDNFEEQKQFRPDFSCEGIFGGELIAARSSSFVCLYDWKEMRLIRKIEVTPKAVRIYLSPLSHLMPCH
jgi:coatomer subunit beta'